MIGSALGANWLRRNGGFAMAHGNQQRGPGVRPLGRRRFLQITAAGLGAVALMRTTDGRVAHAQFDELYRLARAEGQLNLYGGGPTAPFEASGRQFTAAFPGITVNVTGGFSNVLAPEIDRQIAAGSVECDVTVLQTLQDFERWKQQNALLPFRPDGFDQIPDGFKDPDATSVGLRVGAVAFAYNPDRLPEDVVPATAQDFLDPQLGGLCITCYPQDDDLTLYRYTTIVDKYGWDWMDAFMVNPPVHPRPPRRRPRDHGRPRGRLLRFHAQLDARGAGERREHHPGHPGGGRHADLGAGRRHLPGRPPPERREALRELAAEPRRAKPPAARQLAGAPGRAATGRLQAHPGVQRAERLPRLRDRRAAPRRPPPPLRGYVGPVRGEPVI